MSTIVYIDDEPLLCDVIKDVLEESGAEVYAFIDPEEAIAYINENQPALVICDYRMPSMNGLEVFDRLREKPPFVLISGYLSIEDTRGRAITEILHKPVRPEELLAFVVPFIDEAG